MSNSLLSQNLNFDSIKKNVQDESSNFFYEKLMYKFKFDPTSLSDEELQNLYYGKYYSKYNAMELDFDYLDCTGYFSKGNYKKAIVSGEKFLQKDPTNVEVIAIMQISYSKKDKSSDKNILYTNQLKVLTDCILKSGDGKTKETSYLVTSVGEEFLISDLLGKNIRRFQRKSTMQKDGVVDEFYREDEKIYFKVLYNTEKYKL